MGSFTLKLKNAPSGARYWYAAYSQYWVYSGWLDIGDPWNCPYGACGAADLMVWVVDSDYNALHLKENLGPIYDDKSYVYDCSSETLYQETLPPEFRSMSVTEFVKR